MGGTPMPRGVARASCPCFGTMGGTPMPRGCGTGILPVFASWAGRPCRGGVARASCPCLPHGRDAHATRSVARASCPCLPHGRDAHATGVWHGHLARVCAMGGTPMPRGVARASCPCSASSPGTFQIQRQKPFEDCVIREIGGPAVGGGDGGIKPSMAVGQPCRTGVVELCKGALPEFCG